MSMFKKMGNFFGKKIGKKTVKEEDFNQIYKD